MVVVHRAHGFRFVIYTLDHEPAHVHLTGPGQAKINLLGPDGVPEAVYSIGINRSTMRRLMAKIIEHQAFSWLNGSIYMDQVSDRQLDLAEACGRDVLNTELRAAAAHYDRASGRVIIDLLNGCTYAFPAKLVQDLQGASDDDLAGVEVDGMGLNLHWPALDVDLLTPALVSGLFGTRAWMTRELARLAGKATSPAKTAAARVNGAKGGRPRKAAGA